MLKTRIGIVLFVFTMISLIMTTFSYAAGFTTETGSTLNVNDGTLNLTEEDITNAGTLQTSTGTININGNWINTGTFVAGTGGTVAFTGSAASTITGANTFTNITSTQVGKRLNFEAGKTQTIAGIWTLTGGAGNLIQLRSTAAGTQWSVNPSGTKNISFVDVKDSRNLSTTIINPPSSTDSGNNTKWFTPITPPVAAFTATPVTGIVPLVSTFTDQSTGNITSWLWNFGDNSTSTQQNPSHTYSSAGSFAVSLTVTGPGGSHTETKTGFITAQNPTPSITSITPGSALPGDTINVTLTGTNFVSGMTINLSGTGVTISNTSINSSTSATATLAIATSATTGVRTVSVTTSGGTSNTVNFTINSPAPLAAFTASSTSGTSPFAVIFTDQSTGDITSRSWSFGDGSTSTQQNPPHTYSSAGSFTVSLTVSGPGGTDTEIKTGFITVTKPTPSITSISPGSALPGDTINISLIGTNFVSGMTINLSGTGVTISNIAVNSSTSATATFAITASASTGVRTVSITTSGKTSNTVNFTINSPAPLAAFTASPTTGTAPLAVTYTDQSSGDITSRLWNFGDGSTSTQQNPSHTYITSGNFTVTLTVTGPGGSDSKKKTGFITVNIPPVAKFTADKTTGTTPLTIKFTDQSSGDITSRSWNFGDGSSDTQQNPSHTYNTAGNFTVSLTVTGLGGSVTETKVDFIIASKKDVPPVAKFTADKSAGTEPLSVSFKDQSTGDITSWLWGFGDGSTGTQQNPSHTYNSAGNFTVSLTVVGPGGSVTETKVDFIIASKKNTPPVAKFTANKSAGTKPLKVNFADQSTGDITSWQWEFGDGDINTQKNPSHIYNNVGSFAVSLTVTGPGGSSTETKEAFVSVSEPDTPPVAKFSVDKSAGVELLTVNFTDQSTGDINTWQWDFGDSNSSTQKNPSHTYSTVGEFTVSLTATGPGGSDTETKNNFITLSKKNTPPDANFSADRTTGTGPLTVNFSDQSTGDITSWLWDFGDENTSTQKSPSRTYNRVGEFTVSLIVTGPGGSDSEEKMNFITVECRKPLAEFKADKLSILKGETVQFTDLSSEEPNSWLWNFGDGTALDNSQNPAHVYVSEGKFDVTLTVSSSCGSDAEEKLTFIEVGSDVKKPEAGFTSDVTSGLEPLTVSFQDKSTGPPTSWVWEFGDGDKSDERNPVQTYRQCGIFSPLLIVSNEKGEDRLEQINLINVICGGGPTTEFSATPTAGFAPLEVQFTNKSAGVPTSFAWRFGDGGVSTDENPLHEYKTLGIFTVSLLTSNEAGADLEVKTNLINIGGGGQPVAEFQASPLIGFAPFKVQFTDISEGNIDNWIWDFGDGATSLLQNPNHDYLNAGFYNVKLIISGADGTGLENKINLINILEGEGPTAAFLAEPLTGNAPFTVHFFDTSSGEISNQTWVFGDGATSEEKNPAHTYKTAGSFNVKLTVSGKNGTSEETKRGLIRVEDGTSPTAGFDKNRGGTEDEGDLSKVDTNSTVKFTDLSSSPDDEIIKWEWDFGDGTKSEKKDPEHTYTGEDGDTFTVSLTVLNSEGLDTVTKPSFVEIKSTIIPGFVKGKVTDKITGDVISGASIIAINSSDRQEISVETTDDGLYSIQAPPGDYDITVNKEGFSEFSTKIRVLESETETVDIELELIGGEEEEEPPKATGSLSVEPETAGKSFGFKDAVVTIIDEDGVPIEGVKVNASAAGLTAFVDPTVVETDGDGNAKFRFRFGFFTSNGVIIFEADGVNTKITQE